MEQVYLQYILIKAQSELSPVENFFVSYTYAYACKCFWFSENIMVLVNAQFVNLRAFFTFLHTNSEMIFKKKGIVYYKLSKLKMYKTC